MKRKLSLLIAVVMLLSVCVFSVGMADDELVGPTDFVFDVATGEFSFTANDTGIGYYFVRVYSVQEGEELAEYKSTSKRLSGGKAGVTISGKLNVSDLGWGLYDINLVSFAASGTGKTNPPTVTLHAYYGVGGTLERPEAMIFTEGNRAQVIIDWWTLSDYMGMGIAPEIAVTFYTDEAMTEAVLTDTISTKWLQNNHTTNPPASITIWGYSQTPGAGYMYTTNEDVDPSTVVASPFGGGTGTTMAFIKDIFTYTLPAGTYYVGIQTLSGNDYYTDSKVCVAGPITMTDDEPLPDYSGEYTVTKSELWKDPGQEDMPGTNPFQRDDRIDLASSQETTAQIVD